MQRPTREVLVTGATGFIGKVLVEALVRRRSELGIQRIHVLIRPKLGLDASERFRLEIGRSRCFQTLESGWQDFVSVVSGDLSEADCAISDADADSLRSDVTHVIHAAASVEFDLPLERAVAENVTAGLHLLELVRSFERLHSMVALSTAYVSPHGGDARHIPEDLVILPRPAAEILADIEAGTLDARALLAQTGHPNTYTLSKCIAEHLLTERRGDVPLSLVRPSIVSATWREPFPGWIDSHAAFAAFVMLIGTGQLRAVAARTDARVDVVPCDEVVAQTIDAGFNGAAKSGGPVVIRHAVAGMERACRIDLCREVITRYFGAHRLGQGPQLRHVGPLGVGFRLNEFLHHDARIAATSAWLLVSGRRREARSLAGLADRLRYLNRVFPYFTHNSFHFETSSPFGAAGFDPAAYVETVCDGLYTLHRRGSLLRKPRSPGPGG